MEPFQSTGSNSPQDDAVARLEQSLNSLRRLFNIVLVALIILSGSLFIFLLRELGLSRKQITQLSQFVAEYEKNVPMIEEFAGRLQAFAETNTDFKPILIRYFGATNTAARSVSPSTPSDLSLDPLAPSAPASR